MDNYQWTQHALYKLKYYQLSKQRITRVIRNPERIEEGIVSKTIAVMQPTSIRIKNGKKVWSQEIWAMYQVGNHKAQITKHKQILKTNYQTAHKLKIISAWRYPGMSPKNNPIPEEIWNEIRDMI